MSKLYFTCFYVRSHKLRKAPVSFVMSVDSYKRGFNFVARQL